MIKQTALLNLLLLLMLYQASTADDNVTGKKAPAQNFGETRWDSIPSHLRVRPTKVLKADSTLILVTTNGILTVTGNETEPIDTPLDYLFVLDVAILHDTLWVVATAKGAYYTNNGGFTWSKLASATHIQTAKALAVEGSTLTILDGNGRLHTMDWTSQEVQSHSTLPPSTGRLLRSAERTVAVAQNTIYWWHTLDSAIDSMSFPSTIIDCATKENEIVVLTRDSLYVTDGTDTRVASIQLSAVRHVCIMELDIAVATRAQVVLYDRQSLLPSTSIRLPETIKQIHSIEATVRGIVIAGDGTSFELAEVDRDSKVLATAHPISAGSEQFRVRDLRVIDDTTTMVLTKDQGMFVWRKGDAALRPFHNVLGNGAIIASCSAPTEVAFTSAIGGSFVYSPRRKSVQRIQCEVTTCQPQTLVHTANGETVGLFDGVVQTLTKELRWTPWAPSANLGYVIEMFKVGSSLALLLDSSIVLVYRKDSIVFIERPNPMPVLWMSGSDTVVVAGTYDGTYYLRSSQWTSCVPRSSNREHVFNSGHVTSNSILLTSPKGIHVFDLNMNEIKRVPFTLEQRFEIIGVIEDTLYISAGMNKVYKTDLP